MVPNRCLVRNMMRSRRRRCDLEPVTGGRCLRIGVLSGGPYSAPSLRKMTGVWSGCRFLVPVARWRGDVCGRPFLASSSGEDNGGVRCSCFRKWTGILGKAYQKTLEQRKKLEHSNSLYGQWGRTRPSPCIHLTVEGERERRLFQGISSVMNTNDFLVCSRPNAAIHYTVNEGSAHPSLGTRPLECLRWPGVDTTRDETGCCCFLLVIIRIVWGYRPGVLQTLMIYRCLCMRTILLVGYH